MQEEELKQKVLKKIEQTKILIVEYKDLTQPVEPDCAIGRISRMDHINNKSVTEASLRQAEEKLKNLERILAMFGTDDFGKCIKCHREIPFGRLLFRPESLYCVDCAR